MISDTMFRRISFPSLAVHSKSWMTVTTTKKRWTNHSSMTMNRFLSSSSSSSPLSSSSISPSSTYLYSLNEAIQEKYSSRPPSSRWAMAASAAAAAATLGYITWTNTNGTSPRTTDCSGILGVVGKQGNSRDFFLNGLTVYKNRGFDGVGMASLDGTNRIVISKMAVESLATAPPAEGSSTSSFPSDGDPMQQLVTNHYASMPSISSLPTSIAHTRWATYGSKLDRNNVHPHLDSSGKIAIVHNGTLTNARELRKELQDLGHTFTSQTDSEVIAKYIGHYYAKGNTSIKEATAKALAKCNGTWGLCILCSDTPHELVVACNGSSLYLGLGDDRIYVASELGVLAKYTTNFILLKDGEIGVLQADGHSLDLSRAEEAPQDEGVREDELSAVPHPYPYWTLKEIMDQPEAIARALSFGARMSWEKVVLGGLDKSQQKLARIQHVILAGCGSSLNAAKYGERLFKHLQAVDGRIAWMDVVEAQEDDYPTKSAALIAVSQSGESKDVHRIVEEAQAQGVTTLGVVNAVGSLIARTTKLGVYCNAGQENGIAATKTFTSQVTILALVALWFRELQDKILGGDQTASFVESDRLKEALLRLPISIGMALKTREQCQEVAKRLKDKEHCFVLGKGKVWLQYLVFGDIVSTFLSSSHSVPCCRVVRTKGFGEPIAYEGALKLKEMANLHAEGYSGGALKHGPFALIENDATGKFGATPIIMLVLDDQHAHHMRTACEEVSTTQVVPFQCANHVAKT